jgi:hypothetical protein
VNSRDIFENTKIKDRLLRPNTGALLQWRTLGNAILKTKGGQNFLTTTVTNHAHIFIQASPLDEGFGNFPQNALFVPIVYKLAAMSIKPSTLAYRFDEATINLRDKEYSEKTIVKLKKDGVEIIPTQRVVGNEIILELPKANEIESGNLAGYYDMMVGQKVEKTLALNYNNSESLMDSYAISDLKSIFTKNKNIKILDQENAADLATEYASQTQGSYFWKYFVIAALLFLALEILIIRFWK